VTTLPEISADELLRKIEDGDEFVLVDALAPIVYAHSHLPGAINIPPSDFDPFWIRARIPVKSTEIDVYCANPDCGDSVEIAQRLMGLGYTDVRHYAGGKDEWKERGLPLERAGKPYVPAQ
jgi:rhodanese-related sulfurtransferase